MSNGYRGEVRPRRQPVRHHVSLHAGAHSALPVDDPFGAISSSQFPAMYIRNPIRNQYRRYMRAKTPYMKQRP